MGHPPHFEEINMLCFYDDDDKYSEHDLAWMTKDWDAVQKLADSYKETPENEFFQILNNINYAKQPLNVSLLDSYSQFAINKVLAKSMDCVQSVHYANMFLHGLDDQIHHDFLLLTIPQGKRYAKGTKLDESFKDKFIIQLLAKFYKCNEDKAYQYQILLEKKKVLDVVLKKAKPLVDDVFIKSITKNVKEQKELKKLL